MLAAPAVAFAESDSPITRAHVRSELMQLEAAGYKPASGDEPNYPTNIQEADARVSAHGQTYYGGALGRHRVRESSGGEPRVCNGLEQDLFRGSITRERVP